DMATSKNPNFVAILRCSQKITPYICAIDTLLQSSRLREMAPAVIPAPTASPHRVMTAYAASQFFARALSCLEL
ncbi:MAG: hypothetical protein Q8L69_13840, partial [Gallionellaceae bacterium]|nr:hypothetical protein [Gallionellaceae bacterium]